MNRLPINQRHHLCPSHSELGKDTNRGYHGVEQDILAPLERLGTRFQEAAGATAQSLKGEFKVLEYANQYISLATLEYSTVWWRMVHSPDAKSWKNITLLAQLLFALPCSVQWKTGVCFL
jgi:hypothetical protein